MIQLQWQDQMILLKSPEMGNTLGLKNGVIIKRSMDRTAYSFVSPDKNRILVMSFQNMSRLQIRNYFNFIDRSKGKDVILTDHDGTRWRGDITSVPVSSNHNGINNSDLNITFEGVQIA